MDEEQLDVQKDDSGKNHDTHAEQTTGSLMRQIKASGEWESKTKPVEGGDTRPLPRLEEQADASTEVETEGSAFPDLPAELVPRRPDGTGPFTEGDITAMRESGDTADLNAEEKERATKAVAHLRRKIDTLTLEFNEGRLNHDQFQAIYIRYGEQILLIQQLMEQDPLSGEWQSVAQEEGSTHTLRQQLAAQVLGCALCLNQQGKVLETLGNFDLDKETVAPILSGLADTAAKALEQGHRSTQIEGGRWLGIVPGWYTTTIVLYSKEPSGEQLDLAAVLHKDFEKANIKALDSGKAGEWLLIYPQRALFSSEPE